MARLLIALLLFLVTVAPLRSAGSLLGNFVGASGDSAAVVTGARTTTAGSTVTICSGNFGGSDATHIDSLANTYTKVGGAELDFASTALIVSYNVAGTRGATHTTTSTRVSGTSDHSISSQEWAGIAVSPTIVTNTATGTGTTASVSVVVSAASLVVGCLSVEGATMTVADGATQAEELDEGFANTELNVAYKVGQTGTPSLSWTLGGSVAWGAIVVAFTEAGGGAAPTPRLLLMGVGE